MKWKIIVFFFFVYFFALWTLTAQQDNKVFLPGILSEAGHPFITNYSPDDYHALNQNWGIVQDSLGIMYFANGGGVLTYDGTDWELLALPNQSHTKSIAVDESNRVYVGATKEFGYLEPDPYGKMEYVSISDNLKESDKNFSAIWKVHVTSDGVFFRSSEALFRWKNGHIKIWKAEDDTFFNSFWVDNLLYVSTKKKGLQLIDGDTLHLAHEGGFLTNKRVGLILPYNDNQILIGTTDVLYLYGKQGFVPFQTEIDGFIKENGLYSGYQLADGNYALAGYNQGMAIIDGQGNKLFSISNKDIPPAPVLNFYQDRSGILWAGLEYGISKVEFPSPFTHYQHQSLKDRCTAITRYKQKLYAGTGNGIYRLEVDEFGNANFVSFLDIKGRIWDLLVFDDKLLIPSEKDGGIIYEYEHENLKAISKCIATSFYRSNIDSNRVFISRSDGFGSIYFSKGKWIDEGLLEGINGVTVSIVEESTGTLWLSTSGSSVWRISFENIKNAQALKIDKVKKYETENGLPEDVGEFYMVDGTVLYSTLNNKEIFEFDEKTNRFIPDKTINSLVGFSEERLHINEIDDLQNIYFSITKPNNIHKGMVAWHTKNNTYKIQDLSLEHHADLIGWALFKENDSIIWYGGKDGILRQDLKSLSMFSNSQKPYRALINRIAYQEDSLLIRGAYRTHKSILPFERNSFRIKFAYPNFYKEQGNQFQHRLDGFDTNWSKWSLETQKDYTNLSEGNYSFKVRAKNIFGQVSKEGTYSFTILPPWYRTWWAYICYGFLAILGLWGYGQWRSNQIRQKNLALETLVTERTEEVREKNKLLSYQTEKLKEMDTMKTRLFANISHEFRTPLTLIKGPIEKLEQEKKTAISMPNIKMIRRNANRLLNLVNQLLDLSKLDSGKLKLSEAEGDVFKCIRAAASAFSSHAASRQMDYQIKIPARLLWASFDRDKTEKILYNLLSNAFKFTNDEGQVILDVVFRNDRLQFKVSDTGCGIAPDKLPHIFDRFFQVDDSYTKEKEGSGIGLALTKELVELMGGTIYLESDQGKGTSFKVVLPMQEIKSYSRVDASDEITTPGNAMDPVVLTEQRPGGTDDRILVIEDNNDMRHFIREQLIQEYQVFEARNGKEGLEMANEIVPNLIVTDLMMPQMDGITLCKKLKTHINTSHIPVIMLTAKAGIENKLEGLETGADDYLTKPFNAKELQIRAKNLLEQRQQLRELFSKNISLDPKEIMVTSLDQKFLQQVLELMEQKYSDSEFGLPQMQKELGMSKASLHNKLKAVTGHPPGELLRNFRLKRASQLLQKSGEQVSQVAYDVGFNSLQYFTRCFKDYYGVSPSNFNKKD